MLTVNVHSTFRFHYTYATCTGCICVDSCNDHCEIHVHMPFMQLSTIEVHICQTLVHLIFEEGRKTHQSSPLRLYIFWEMCWGLIIKH